MTNKEKKRLVELLLERDGWVLGEDPGSIELHVPQRNSYGYPVYYHAPQRDVMLPKLKLKHDVVCFTSHGTLTVNGDNIPLDPNHRSPLHGFRVKKHTELQSKKWEATRKKTCEATERVLRYLEEQS